MNNAIKDSNNNRNETENKSNFYKINIIEPNEKEKLSETPKNNKKNNKLFLTPIQARRKSKYENDNEIKNFLLNSVCSKRGSIIVPNTKDQPQINLLKTKAAKEKIIISPKYKKSTFGCENYSPKLKRSVNYNININNNNVNNRQNSILNILKLTSNIYNNDEHLKKDVITKKIDINNIPNIKKSELFTSGNIDKLIKKKKLIITFGLNEQNEINVNQNEFKSNKLNSFKRKISTGSKGKSSIDRNSFSNYIKINKRNKSPSKERHDESNKNNDINLVTENSTKNKPNKEGDVTSKNIIFNLGRAKTLKTKSNCDQKIIEEKRKFKSKISVRTSKSKTSKKICLNSNKNQVNDTINNSKKESPKNELKTKKENKKICLFCCLSQKSNDSDEN